MSKATPKADYSRYVTSKDVSMLAYTWRTSIDSDIRDGLFVSFSSGNSAAKQLVIVMLDRYGFKSKITNLGCGVHKIEVVNESK